MSGFSQQNMFAAARAALAAGQSAADAVRYPVITPTELAGERRCVTMALLTMSSILTMAAGGRGGAPLWRYAFEERP